MTVCAEELAQQHGIRKIFHLPLKHEKVCLSRKQSEHSCPLLDCSDKTPTLHRFQIKVSFKTILIECSGEKSGGEWFDQVFLHEGMTTLTAKLGKQYQNEPLDEGKGCPIFSKIAHSESPSDAETPGRHLVRKPSTKGFRDPRSS